MVLVSLRGLPPTLTLEHEMPRINPVESNAVTEPARELLDGVKQKFGMVPNIMQTMAHAPAVLGAYLDMAGALGESSLSPQLRERLALAVAETNRCTYCLAAHATVGGMLGLDAQAIADSRRGTAADPADAAALAFARRLVEGRGWVDDADLTRLRDAGFGDGAILEIVAVVVLNLFTNYVNHVAGTEVDFPAPPPLE
jgi:uncharacterized peroxidase-related enzyme